LRTEKSRKNFRAADFQSTDQVFDRTFYEKVRMTTELKRKLYRRGSSYETTIPLPLLFALDKNKKHNVLFKFDPQLNRWYVEFEEMKDKKEKQKKISEAEE